MSLDHEKAAYVADLLWAINSPVLMEFDDKTWQPPLLASNQFDHDALWDAMQPRVRRVGYYFEKLISFYLTQISDHQLLAQQIQIVGEGRTIGEIDFLFEDSSGQICHLETAVKYFLCLPEKLHQGSRLVGPNSNDNFERKASRLVDHQLPLSARFPPNLETKPIQVDRQFALVKGRIYHHINACSNALTVNHLSDHHLQGSWLRRSEWHAEKFTAHKRIKLLQKPRWLSNAHTPDQIDTLDFGELLSEHFSQSHRPIHGYIDDTPGTFFFVVADHWPDRI